MRQFVKDNRPFAQTSREDFAQKYLSEGCTEVPILYNGDLFKPLWNGSEWIESATSEEIAEQELEQQKLLKQQQYEELLPTDWYVVRFIETGVAIPEEITQQRQEIRNKYN